MRTAAAILLAAGCALNGVAATSDVGVGFNLLTMDTTGYTVAEAAQPPKQEAETEGALATTEGDSSLGTSTSGASSSFGETSGDSTTSFGGSTDPSLGGSTDPSLGGSTDPSFGDSTDSSFGDSTDPSSESSGFGSSTETTETSSGFGDTSSSLGGETSGFDFKAKSAKLRQQKHAGAHHAHHRHHAHVHHGRHLLMETEKAQPTISPSSIRELGTGTSFTRYTEEQSRLLTKFGPSAAFYGIAGVGAEDPEMRNKLEIYAAGNVVFAKDELEQSHSVTLASKHATPQFEHDVCSEGLWKVLKDDKRQAAALGETVKFVRKYGSHYVTKEKIGSGRTVRAVFSGLTITGAASKEGSYSTAMAKAVQDFERKKQELKRLVDSYAAYQETGSGNNAEIVSNYARFEEQLDAIKQASGMISFQEVDIPERSTIGVEIAPISNILRKLKCDIDVEKFIQSVRTVFDLAQRQTDWLAKNVDSKTQETRFRLVAEEQKNSWFRRMNTFLTERQNLDEGEESVSSESTTSSTAATTTPPPPPSKPELGTDGGDGSVDSYSAQTIYNFMENYGENDSPQFDAQIDVPIMAMQTMRRMQESCTTKCYQQKQYRILREFLNLGTKATPAPPTNDISTGADDVATEATVSMDPVMGSAGAALEKPKEESDPASELVSTDGILRINLNHLQPEQRQIIKREEKSCLDQCLAQQTNFMDKITATGEGGDGPRFEELNMVFKGLTEEACTMCSHIVMFDSVPVFKSLTTRVIESNSGRDPAKQETPSFCVMGDKLTAIQRGVCKSMGKHLGVEIARETHYTNALDNHLTMSSRLQELTNCQGNCNADSYSYTNLPNKSPAAWSTQICGRMFDCPQNDPDFLDVVQRLRSEKLENFDRGLVESTNILGNSVSLATEFKKRKNERVRTSAAEMQKVQVNFCDEVEEVTYIVLAIRQQRINEMQRQRCQTCMRAVRAAAFHKDEFDFKTQVCGDAPDKGKDKIPAVMEDVPILKDPAIAVLTQGYDTIDNAILAREIQEQLPQDKRKKFFRRRLLMAGKNAQVGEQPAKEIGVNQRATKTKFAKPERGERRNAKKCAEEGSFESYAECRYSKIESDLVECDGMQYRPRDYLKKMDKVVEENYQEKWTGSKKWCESKEKELEAEVDKLLEVLLKITGTEELGEDANLASKIKVYNDLHSKVFIPMPLSGIGGFRTQFKTPDNGEFLKDYGAPLYAGSSEASLCVETQYCTPNDAMAIKGLKLAAAPKQEGGAAKKSL